MRVNRGSGWRAGVGVRCASAALVAAFLAGAGAGCVGYRLGTTLPPGIQTVYVPAFVNRTGEPRIEIEASRATLEELQTDGTLRVAGAAEADSVLSVTLVGYRLDPLRYERDRPKTTREYRLQLTADIVFRRVSPEAVLVKKTVQGDATFEMVGDLATSKDGALPQAARDLAHDIVESIVEYW